MSPDQSLSTEDLAGRHAPTQSESAAPPTAAGAHDTSRTADVSDHDGSDHDISDHDVSDPGVTLQDPGVSDPGGDPGAGEYGDTPAAGTGNGPTASRATDDTGRDAGEADDGRQRPEDENISLVDSAQADQFRARWADVQVRFVDDPREAVGAADALVAEAMQSLASAFADHKSRLETQWQGGGDVDTEELRLALRRYRSFFQRLLET